MKAACLTLICPVSLAILTGFIVQMFLWLGGDIMVMCISPVTLFCITLMKYSHQNICVNNELWLEY